MTVELKELTNSKEFQALVDEQIKFKNEYTRLLKSVKRLDKVSKVLAGYRKKYVKAGRKGDYRGHGVPMEDLPILHAAIHLEDHHQNVVAFADKHSMEVRDVNELIDAKAYFQDF